LTREKFDRHFSSEFHSPESKNLKNQERVIIMSVAVRESVVEESMTMRVKKRNGGFEPVDVNKIVRAVGRCAEGLKQVDTLRVATKTIGGLYEGATTKELDKLSINTAASLAKYFNRLQSWFNQRTHRAARRRKQPQTQR
jgi:hypothetical protein